VAVAVDSQAGSTHAPGIRAAALLVQNKDRVVSRDRLLERSGDTIVRSRSVDVHVGRLRSKLGAASHQIETVVGLGYRFID
jgi:DNA-binding response OmpR family regulator